MISQVIGLAKEFGDDIFQIKKPSKVNKDVVQTVINSLGFLRPKTSEVKFYFD